jgi:hypothetical protein
MCRCLTTFTALFITALLYGQPDCKDTLIIVPNEASELYLQWHLGRRTTTEHIQIATGYGQSALAEINPILRFRDVEPCDLILTPFSYEMIDSVGRHTSRPLYYRVRRQETLFGIARRLLHIPVHRIMEMNALDDPNLRDGQILHVGWLSGSSDRTFDSPTVFPAWSPGDGYLLDTHLVNSAPGKKYTKDKGVAWWNKSRPDSNLFALHRSAPVNSLIEIHNPMFGRTVWAKVIGPIPPTFTEDISVIVSEGVARYLGAIDGRFYVEMSYELK